MGIIIIPTSCTACEFLVRLTTIYLYICYCHADVNVVSSDNRTAVESRRSLYESFVSPSVWVNIEGLVPYSEYTVQVNASNTRGYVLSNVETLSTPPDGESNTPFTLDWKVSFESHFRKSKVT